MELSEIREKIDGLDEKILSLFLERMKLSRSAADYKAEHKLPTLNKDREREILKRVCGESGDMEQYAHRLFCTLFELSRSYQTGLYSGDSNVRGVIEQSLGKAEKLFPQTGSVACQGIEGAYSQMAADRMLARCNVMYFKSFEGVFDAVECGLCRFGVLPIENSSNGSVRAVYDLLIRHKNISIVRSARLCVTHELLVKPGVKLSDITEIHSHEQAIGQCSEFIKSLGDKVKIIPSNNTAAAAKLVSELPELGTAAISSSVCAKLYGLMPLNVRIQNSENNYTRFICIEKEPTIYPGANRVMLILACENRPGSLYEVLAKFAALGINLIKLESCPIVGHDFEFLFFFEIEASVLDPKVVSMLESLEYGCKCLTYLGNYSEV